MTEQNNKILQILTQALAVIGIVAILAFGLWGTVQIAKNVPGAFSTLANALVSITSVFVPADEGINFSLADTLEADKPFSLGFARTGRNGDGTYYFTYSCHKGLHFEVPSAGGQFSLVACETPISLGDATSIRLIPVSTDNRFLDVVFGVRFVRAEEEGKNPIIGTVQATIVNESVARSDDTVSGSIGDNDEKRSKIVSVLESITSGGEGSGTVSDTNNQSTSTTPASPVVGERKDQVFPVGAGTQPSNPNGQTDLGVTILATGIVDANNNFTPASVIRTNQKAGIQFQIENLGTKTSKEWTFNVVLPTSPIHIFSSPAQQPLAPGDKIVYTIGFDRLRSTGNLEVVVNADPTRTVNEVTEENNIRRATIRVVNQ